MSIYNFYNVSLFSLVHHFIVTVEINKLVESLSLKTEFYQIRDSETSTICHNKVIHSRNQAQ